MKKGDVVTIKDSSFSLAIVDDSLEHHPGEVQKERQIVIAINCDLPGENWQGEIYHNNAIVRGQISGRITFVQQRFCHLIAPTHKVMVDIIFNPGYGVGGRVIEISNELYKEIKK